MLHRTTKSTLPIVVSAFLFVVITTNIFVTTGRCVSAVVPLNRNRKEQQHLQPPPPPQLTYRRRLAPDKTVTIPSPTINVIPSTVPTSIETSSPTINIIPSNVPSIQPQKERGNNDDTNAPLSSPITLPSTPPAPAPVVAVTPSKAPTRSTTTTSAPTSSSSSPSTLLTQNVSDFDVLVTAVVTSDQAIAEQLLNYRKELRIALQDYLFQSMKNNLGPTPPTQIELYAISSLTTPNTRTRTRHHRILQSSDSNSENPLAVEQWYSYGGVMAFPNGTDAATISTTDSIYQKQALALSDTVTVQQSLTTSVQSVITIQTITVRNAVNRTDDTNHPNKNSTQMDDDSTNNNDNSTTIIATMIAAGSVGLLAVLGIVWRCRRHGPLLRMNDPMDHSKPPISNTTMTHQPPSGLTSPTTQASMTSCSVPFSPYGKECNSDEDDDDDNDNDNDDHHHCTRNNRNHVQSIVHDLEEMEGTLQQRKPPSPPPPPPPSSPLRYSTTTTTILVGTNTTEEPYLQLDLSNGLPSGTGSSMSPKNTIFTDHPYDIRNSTSIMSFDERGTNPTVIDSSGLRMTASEPQPIQYYIANEEDSIQTSHIDTTKMIDPDFRYCNRTMNSYNVSESTTTTAGSIDPNIQKDDSSYNNDNACNHMYSVPVVSMSNSRESMDGYSLTSGFYGGQRPMNLRTTTTASATPNRKDASSMVGSSPVPKTTTTDPVVPTRGSVPLVHVAPSQPLSMSAPRNMVGLNIRTPSSTNDRSINQLSKSNYRVEEDYGSVSESQFTYTQVGIVPLNKLVAMGPMLNSMGMDSCDSSIDNHNEAAGDSSMLQLNYNIGMISDTPTFHRCRVSEQHHFQNEEETPITNNSKRSFGPNARSAVPLLLNNDNGDDPSPIRATTLDLPASLHNTSRLQNDITSNNSSLNSTLSSDIITMNKMTYHDGDIESQPSDEVMGDSMEQDLQGFADEIDQMERDIGVSIGHDAAKNSRGRQQQLSAPNQYLLQTRVPSDEFVENENDIITFTATVITPDDPASKRNDNKIRNTRGRR